VETSRCVQNGETVSSINIRSRDFATGYLQNYGNFKRAPRKISKGQPGSTEICVGVDHVQIQSQSPFYICNPKVSVSPEYLLTVVNDDGGWVQIPSVVFRFLPQVPPRCRLGQRPELLLCHHYRQHCSMLPQNLPEPCFADPRRRRHHLPTPLFRLHLTH